MSPGLFYVRYLAAPTSMAAAGGALVLLLRALAGPLGAHAPTVSLAGALAVIGISLGLCEHRYPAEGVRQRRTPRQRRGDIAYTALTALSILAWVRALTWLGARRAEGLFGLSAATWPLAAQAIFTFFVSEMVVLSLHWASHRSGVLWLWRIHAPHHRPEGISLLSASRVHPIDLAFQTLSLAPPALLGATPEAIVFSFAYQLGVGAVQHSDLDIRLGLFNWILPGPEVHRIHHHIDPAVAESFSLNAPILDLLLRTNAPFRRPGEVPMGVAGETD